MDSDSKTALQQIAASEAGLPAQLAGRVRGETIGELRADASKLAVDVGYAKPTSRDDNGRFAGGDVVSMNARIRRAAGR